MLSSLGHVVTDLLLGAVPMLVGACRHAGSSSCEGRDMALLSVTHHAGSAVCFGLCITSAAVLSGVCLGKEGCLSLALLIKNSRIQCTVLISSPGRMQTLTSFLAAQFPWELCPRGISWKMKGRRKTGQLHDVRQELTHRPLGPSEKESFRQRRPLPPCRGNTN